jgi:large subunit ribosomal protein L29
MKSREIREMTSEEILNAIEDSREAMFKFRFQKASGQLEDETAPTRMRREVARMKTILRERELANNVAGKGK